MALKTGVRIFLTTPRGREARPAVSVPMITKTIEESSKKSFGFPPIVRVAIKTMKGEIRISVERTPNIAPLFCLKF